MPGIADKFELSPMFAGFVCSLWCFVRLGVSSCSGAGPAGITGSGGWPRRSRLLIFRSRPFSLSPNLAVLIVAQFFFGGAIGLIYYSSLFYSMDASEAKSEHGGIHEAAIGLGNCVGPAIGAAALQWVPQYADSGAIAVSVLLLGGFGGLLAIWKTAR